jgi:hypothetical protein
MAAATSKQNENAAIAANNPFPPRKPAFLIKAPIPIVPVTVKILKNNPNTDIISS